MGNLNKGNRHSRRYSKREPPDASIYRYRYVTLFGATGIVGAAAFSQSARTRAPLY
jgi:hypothetical protein